MSVIKPRTKVIFFRVSVEEFHEMEITCSKVGARSISEFARGAARRWVDEARIDHLEIIFDKLAAIERVVDELQGKVQSYRRLHSETAGLPHERDLAKGAGGGESL